MQTTIEMELDYAYNAWLPNKCFDDKTAYSLLKCYERTSGSKIDKAASSYPVEFLNYVDKRLREI